MRKSPRFNQKSPKKLRSYLPEPKILRIQQRHISGETNSEIARSEGCDRHTVGRIIKTPEMAAYIEEMRARFNGFAPLALDAVEHGLTIAKDTRVACEVLKAIGIIEPRKDKMPVADEQKSEEQLTIQWMGKLAFLALEKHAVYGTKLPPGVEELKPLWEKLKNNDHKTQAV